MTLHSYALALILLLGVAYAKEKSWSDYPLHIKVVVVNGMNPATIGADCFMSFADGGTVYNVSSNGFCKLFNTGDELRARVYDSKWGIRIVEVLYYTGGKLRTAKYKVNSQIAR